MGVKQWAAVLNTGTSTSTDLTRYKAVWTELHDAMVEVGFTWRSATAGQVADITAITPVPAVGGTEYWRIYELNDSLSATLPIYIKLHLSVGPNYGGYPVVHVQIGTTINDSTGVLGGLVTDLRAPLTFGWASVAGKTAAYWSLFSKGEGYCGLVFNVAGVQGAAHYARPSLSLIIERTSDDDGNWTADGYTTIQQNGGATVAGVYPTIHRTIIGTASSVLFDTGWSSRMARVVGGYAGIAHDGAIQFQRIYSLVPQIKPLNTVLMYQYQQIADLTSFVTRVIGEAPVRFLAIGSGSSAVNFGAAPDTTYPGMCMAMRWEA